MQLKVMSFNIRFENPKDGENDWPNRRELFASVVNDFNPHIMGTQEGREPQLRDLEDLLKHHKISDSHRKWIDKRMYPSLFYNPKKIQVLDSGDIWLSETPDVAGSASFGSAFPRLSTWARVVTHPIERREFLVANAHLDHVNPETRSEQVRVLMEELAKINTQNLPLVLIGDFNADPTSQVREILHQNYDNLYDPWTELGQDEDSSFHKFWGSNIEEGARIDWMILDGRIECPYIQLDKTSVEKEKHTLYPSDHYALKGILEL